MKKEDIKKQGYKIFLVLDLEEMVAHPAQLIFARHKKQNGFVYIFKFDGIHYIDSIMTYKESNY